MTITLTIGPDGEFVREPLPEYDPTLLDGRRYLPFARDHLYHYFPGAKPLCGAPGVWDAVGSPNWRIVDCPDCRALGYARQPLLATPHE